MRSSTLNYAENRMKPAIPEESKRACQQKSLLNTLFPTKQKTMVQYYGYNSTNTMDMLD